MIRPPGKPEIPLIWEGRANYMTLSWEETAPQLQSERGVGLTPTLWFLPRSAGEGFVVPDAKVKRSCVTAGLCVKPHVPQTRAQIRGGGPPPSAASLFAFWEKANNNVPAVLDS